MKTIRFGALCNVTSARPALLEPCAAGIASCPASQILAVAPRTGATPPLLRGLRLSVARGENSSTSRFARARFPPRVPYNPAVTCPRVLHNRTSLANRCRCAAKVLIWLVRSRRAAGEICGQQVYLASADMPPGNPRITYYK